MKIHRNAESQIANIKKKTKKRKSRTTSQLQLTVSDSDTGIKSLICMERRRRHRSQIAECEQRRQLSAVCVITQKGLSVIHSITLPLSNAISDHGLNISFTLVQSAY